MENYRKVSTRQDPPPELSQTQIPHVKVSAGGRVKNYVTAAATLLKTAPEIHISGIGQAINKAVSVAEAVARNHKALLKTIIFEVKEIDVWESIHGDLDAIEVTRHLPAIRLTVHSAA
ncbi:hypothetical protein HDV03_001863 [Kappamyces sp. JEL0829]|nr:hypothetical protein HDV03_001863 [Kappamyces sp. JEL0829]KAJ3348630.1 hypothetical protein HDU91_006531 [Kappamyces sp. JEL0680]